MAKIDGYYILVESEEPNYEVDITDQPVEKGINLTDHVKRRARTISLSGYIVGEDASRIRTYLLDAQDNGKIVQYQGRNTFKGLLGGFSTKHDYKTADGFPFTLKLVEIRFAESSYVDTLPPPVKSQAAPVVNAGRKQTKNAKKSKKTSKKKDSKTVQKVTFKKGSPWAE
ncbi:hypothetical protein BVG16_13785 [Paenibacillus selenitireducens]|uniref:Dit-like phage tail protein N-terminal domain-containing protein n=1 Tax=Paenibacillus selenitireducens TaxID=1324314 RepID=A0A1T2XCG3_9BACL|nr:hypothetical protein [Paenibacillus selenitireducens]OPA77518.1 hypothetical protein BVG16_13785 [Paenibacillus selenitireducens]